MGCIFSGGVTARPRDVLTQLMVNRLHSNQGGGDGAGLSQSVAVGACDRRGSVRGFLVFLPGRAEVADQRDRKNKNSVRRGLHLPAGENRGGWATARPGHATGSVATSAGGIASNAKRPSGDEGLSRS